MNNSFKNNIFALEAFKFGYASFIKNIKFLLLSVAVSGLIFVGGLIASALAALLFFVPFLMVLGKLKEMFMRIAMVNSFSAVMQGEAIDKAAQQAVIWKKFLTELFVSFPFSAAFAVLGIFLFVMLFLFLVIMIGYGWIKITLNIVDERENKISNLFVRFGVLLKAFLLSNISLFFLAILWITTIIIFKANNILGIFAIIASFFITLYYAFKLAFCQYFLLDKNVGIIESMKLSFGLKNGILNMVSMFVLFIPVNIVLGLLQKFTATSNLVIIKLIFGLFGTVLNYSFSIIVLIAMGKIYRELTLRNEQNR